MGLIPKIPSIPMPVKIGVGIAVGAWGIYEIYSLNKKREQDKLIKNQAGATVKPAIAGQPKTYSTDPKKNLTYNIGGNKIPASGVNEALIISDIYENTKNYPWWFNRDIAFEAAKRIPVQRVWDVAKAYEQKYTENLVDTLSKVLTDNQWTSIKFYFR